VSHINCSGGKDGAFGTIAFASPRFGIRQIYVLDDPSGSARRVTNLNSDSGEPAIDRVSRRIAFTSYDTDKLQIFVIDPDGSNLEKVSDGSSDDYAPTWSPNGRLLAFTSQRPRINDPSQHIFSMSPDGHDFRQLTNGIGDGNPDWADDGKRILFERNRDIYVMDADGSNVRPYFDNTTLPTGLRNTSTFPAWAPGSNRIAFISLGKLYVAGTEMSAPRVVPTGSVRVLYGAIAWSPDGSKILFGAEDGMYVVQANGKGLDRIVASLIGDGEPSWTT